MAHTFLKPDRKPAIASCVYVCVTCSPILNFNHNFASAVEQTLDMDTPGYTCMRMYIQRRLTMRRLKPTPVDRKDIR